MVVLDVEDPRGSETMNAKKLYCEKMHSQAFFVRTDASRTGTGISCCTAAAAEPAPNRTKYELDAPKPISSMSLLEHESQHKFIVVPS